MIWPNQNFIIFSVTFRVTYVSMLMISWSDVSFLGEFADRIINAKRRLQTVKSTKKSAAGCCGATPNILEFALSKFSSAGINHVSSRKIKSYDRVKLSKWRSVDLNVYSKRWHNLPTDRDNEKYAIYWHKY